MKRTIYLIVISIITICCVIFGTLFQYHENLNFGFFNFSNKDEMNDKVKLEAFDKISIKADVADIIVEKGEEYALSYQCTENLKPEYRVQNGELSVTQKVKKKISFGINNCTIRITIPKQVQLESIDVSMAVGDVTFNGIDAKKYTTNIDVGELTIENAYLGDGIMDSDTGDIEINNCMFDSLDIQSDVGDVEIKSSKILDDYTFDLKTDVGEITINDNDWERKYEKEGSTGTISIKSDVGDIEMKY